MTELTQEGREMSDRLFVGYGFQQLGVERLCNELGELRSRLEKLELLLKKETT